MNVTGTMTHKEATLANMIGRIELIDAFIDNAERDMLNLTHHIADAKRELKTTRQIIAQELALTAEVSP